MQPLSLGAHAAMQMDWDAQPNDYSRCTWSVPSPIGSVLLVGDSQSWVDSDGVIEAARNIAMSTTVASTNGCPFVAPDKASAISGPACGDSVRRTLPRIEKDSPSILLIANAESYPEAVLSKGLKSIPNKLRGRIPVVVIRQPPGGDEWTGQKSILLRPGGADRTSA